MGFWVGFVDGDFVGWWALGSLTCANDSAAPRQAEHGYRLLPRYWRNGLASEGARELLRHRFADLGLCRIFGQTMTVNVASRATMAAVGLEFVRTFFMDWAEPIPGAEQSEVEYAITRWRWQASGPDGR